MLRGLAGQTCSEVWQGRDAQRLGRADMLRGLAGQRCSEAWQGRDAQRLVRAEMLIGLAGQTGSEYHEALPSSVNVQSHLTSLFADDDNAS